MKRRKYWIAAGVILLLAAAGIFLRARRGPQPIPVQIATVVREDLQAKVTANGQVQAQKKVDISATIPGQITRLAVEEGDAVTAGQFLLQIDSVNPRATARSTEFSMQALLEELRSAKVQAAQTADDASRSEQNFAAGILSEAERDRARSAEATAAATLVATERRVDQARAMLEGARDTLAKTTVRSPIAGIVTARRVEEGEVAVIGVQNSPGTVLLTISDMSVVEAEMEVDETSIPSIRVGQEARVRIDAYPNETFHGTVTEVGSSPILAANPMAEAVKFEVKITLADPPESIKPGLSVQADILTGFRPQALTIPIQALVLREIEREPGVAPPRGAPRDEEGIYVIDSTQAVRFQVVKTGMLGELSLEVLEGLAGGERIVTGPFRALRTMKPGDLVREERPGDRPEA